jgi:hypothetical protein
MDVATRIHMLIDAREIGSVGFDAQLDGDRKLRAEGGDYLPSTFDSRAIFARTSATFGWSSGSAFFHRSANFI